MRRAVPLKRLLDVGSAEISTVVWLRDQLDGRLNNQIVSEKAQLIQKDIIPDHIIDDLTYYVARQIGISESEIIRALSDEETGQFDPDEAEKTIEMLGSLDLSFLTIAASFKEGARDYLENAQNAGPEEFDL